MSLQEALPLLGNISSNLSHASLWLSRGDKKYQTRVERFLEMSKGQILAVKLDLSKENPLSQQLEKLNRELHNLAEVSAGDWQILAEKLLYLSVRFGNLSRLADPGPMVTS